MSAQTTAPVVENAGAAKAAEIEAALQDQDIVGQDFERSLQTALATTGGTLLFQMRIDKDDTHEHVAAISIGTAKERRLFLVVQPADGGKLKLEPVETSDNPLARIAPAYAGLVDVFDIAA
ncbi:hypothetical protein SAMN04488498_13923 [Mesorhizobium albiziae]|uniref:Uncharacterized protein n=1 Tax=Neomesorhizobium albiziae TaxID=335020 RepID=A0A1I4F8L2_9HYPH|nr:hypothetical protein [Mesorhizobium albiziae]GLS30710.1 hypothetical protein GCM10007937_24180 [Mesorhizobium albiziae]SFL14322.1 hypothetical protein SAMN04488498_13923 [Mesorhizobium albiziae]